LTSARVEREKRERESDRERSWKGCIMVGRKQLNVRVEVTVGQETYLTRRDARLNMMVVPFWTRM
jgi:hypothetical protein